MRTVSGKPIDNPNIDYTFNQRKVGGDRCTQRTLATEILYSYGKNYLSGSAAIDQIMREHPNIPNREFDTYVALAARLGALLDQAIGELARREHEIESVCTEIYNAWVTWETATMADETQILIADPGQMASLEKIRKSSKKVLDGTGAKFIKNGASNGKFIYYRKFKDGQPLLFLTRDAQTRMSQETKTKAQMFQSETRAGVAEGNWSQTGNQKQLTLKIRSITCGTLSEHDIRGVLELSNVTRAVSIERL